jgi:thiamine-monophosphate kinase
MKISELGQFGLIDAVAKLVESARDDRADSWKNLVIGIGDDCAVWRGDTTNQLGKVDSQVQGVHFDLDTISWEELGWKSLAVELSDVAAMGGRPSYALVSLGLPDSSQVEDVLSFYRGMLSLAAKTGTAIVGGHISASSIVYINVFVVGRTGRSNDILLTRSSAQAGDKIAVTGHLGTAAAGLEMLTRKLKFDARTSRVLRQAFVHPCPRLTEGLALVENGVKNGMDISDGLLSDLKHICRSSGVGAIVESDLIPLCPEAKRAFGERAIGFALSGGEDYELLFTAGDEVIRRVKDSISCQVTIVGEVVSDHIGEVVLVDREGKSIKPGRTGWDHFRV